MNTHSAERLELARGVVAELAEHDWLSAAMVAGSVAHDDTDIFSDVDVLLFANRRLSAEEFEEQKTIAERSGGGFFGGTPEEGFALWRMVGGIRCDLSFGLVDETEELIETMISEPTPNTVSQLIIGGIQSGIPLHNIEQISRWQERASAYPEALARLMVESNLRQQPCHIWQGMGAARGDVLFLHETFLRLADRLVGVLCGLNRVWHPGKLKGLGYTLSKLTIAPREFGARLNALFTTADLKSAVAEAISLVDEVFTLVEVEMPEIDVKGARTRFHWSV